MPEVVKAPAFAASSKAAFSSFKILLYLPFPRKLVICVQHIYYVENIGMMIVVKLKKIIKYLIFGSFIGILLVYLKFKRINIEE